MKTLNELALALTILTTAVGVRADWGSGSFLGSGGCVAPYHRTPANGTPCDNLNHRDYPYQEPGCVPPRKSDLDSSVTMPSYDFTRPDRQSPWSGFCGGLQIRPDLTRPCKSRPLEF